MCKDTNIDDMNQTTKIGKYHTPRWFIIHRQIFHKKVDLGNAEMQANQKIAFSLHDEIVTCSQ